MINSALYCDNNFYTIPIYIHFSCHTRSFAIKFKEPYSDEYLNDIDVQLSQAMDFARYIGVKSIVNSDFRAGSYYPLLSM